MVRLNVEELVQRLRLLQMQLLTVPIDLMLLQLQMGHLQVIAMD